MICMVKPQLFLGNRVNITLNVAPGQIMDLSINKTQGLNVTLHFTSVGDDGIRGNGRSRCYLRTPLLLNTAKKDTSGG